MEEITVPLSDFVKEVAREAAREVLREHVAQCPIKEVQAKVESLQVRFAALVGLMIGSGVLGGSVAAGLVKLLN